jgi:hypothetical protein
MDEKPEAVEQQAARKPWTEPTLVVADISSVTEAFNGGAGDGGNGS